MGITEPVGSFGELPDRFPGIDDLEPKALGRFAMYATDPAASYEALYDHGRMEPHESWHEGVRAVLSTVSEWKYTDEEERVSRAEIVSRIMRDRREEAEIETLISRMQEASSDEGLQLAMDYLLEGGFRIQTRMGASPLFPEGRTKYTSIDDAKNSNSGRLHIPYGSMLVGADGSVLDKDVEEYIQHGYDRKKSEERIKGALEEVGTIDEAHFEELRAEYGSKAAGLICFNEKLAAFNEKLDQSFAVVDIEVPSFIPVGVDMYEAWLADPSSLAERSEDVRAEVLKLVQPDVLERHGGLVAIRSSAVKSEDGEEHTGAGVYKSVAVDPADAEAFREAIEEVYESTRSEAALSYQRSIDVTDEQMGLVIQQYQESSERGGMRGDTYYGHANGSGINPKLIDIHTNVGDLLFDKPAVQSSLMISSKDMHTNVYLHSNPDRDSPLRSAADQAGGIPHAVVLAEQLFGKPMQIEFVNNAIVQVRPLILSLPENPLEFPDAEAASISAGVGVGDMELQELDCRDDNSSRTGFVIFHNEYQFTISGAHNGYDAFPEKGAVILISPSSSGHIQAICREKGLMCFYSRPHNDSLDDLVFDLAEQVRNGNDGTVLRFVSDGYEGRIYKI